MEGRLIEEGDEVVLHYNDGKGPISGIVLNVPQNTGDMWAIGLEGDNLNWRTVYQNPNSSTFERVMLLRKRVELHPDEEVPF